MDNIPQLQQLVREQLAVHLHSKKFKLSGNPLSFGSPGKKLITRVGEGTVPLTLSYDPLAVYPRSNREIRHSHDRYYKGSGDASDSISAGSSTRDGLALRSITRFQTPSYTSLHSTSSPSYRKGLGGKMRRVQLARLDRDEEEDAESISVAGTSLASKSVEDLYAEQYLERETTKRQLDEGLYFTSKIATPRLLASDRNATFKSKDLMNTLIEDISFMSMSTMDSKGPSLVSGTTGSMQEWKTLYNTETTNFDSMALYAEVRYLELKALEGENDSQCTKLKATVCADLLLKLCTATGRYTQVMEPILWEVLNCVFCDFPHGDKVMRSKDSLKGFYAMTTYCDKYREQHELYEDILAEYELVQQGLSMAEVVKKFQTVKMVFNQKQQFSRDSAFFLWKGELRRSKARQRVAKRRALWYRWRKWVAYCKRHSKYEDRDFADELDEKILLLEQLTSLLQGEDATSIVRREREKVVEEKRGIPSRLRNIEIRARFERAEQAAQATVLQARDQNKDLAQPAATTAVESLVRIKRNNMTQTPDAWMTGISEEPFVEVDEKQFPHLKGPSRLARQSSAKGGIPGVTPARHSSVDLSKSPSFKGLTQEPQASPRGPSVLSETVRKGKKSTVGVVVPPIYKLDVSAACELVTSVYERKVGEAWVDPAAINFHKCTPLLQQTREMIYKRYGIKRLSDKFFKGLMAAVQTEGLTNKRLEIFGLLCGMDVPGHEKGDAFTPSQCSFYFRSVAILFGNNLELMSESFDSFEIDREIVLEMLSDLFPLIEKHDDQLAQQIMFEVVDLPRNSSATPGSTLEYKVNIDDLLSLVMEYYEKEAELDPDEEFLYTLIGPNPEEEVGIMAPPREPSLRGLTDILHST
ncbi:hypothetical protein B484DRAFT_445377 [Ochromonadaceae sp. CCMP2298]|nr:hypothetical protein B484DRAFT_445377 [Ochromonadaceae sp. CCMP2298]|mmetsp:Transcript_34610/g.74813  ORF Transcript_34610/g.74813 Transcript_34610/m.74813 type:complete len:868 (-) Transcript_34610:40-2643(-)